MALITATASGMAPADHEIVCTLAFVPLPERRPMVRWAVNWAGMVVNDRDDSRTTVARSMGAAATVAPPPMPTRVRILRTIEVLAGASAGAGAVIAVIPADGPIRTGCRRVATSFEVCSARATSTFAAAEFPCWVRIEAWNRSAAARSSTGVEIAIVRRPTWWYSGPASGTGLIGRTGETGPGTGAMFIHPSDDSTSGKNNFASRMGTADPGRYPESRWA